MKMYVIRDTNDVMVGAADTKEAAIELANEERPGETLVGVVVEGKKEISGFFVGKVPF